MKYAIVYHSLTGNTELLARKIKEVIGEEDCAYFGNSDEAQELPEKLYLGFWTDKGNCDEKMQNYLKSLKNKEVFLFGTAGFGGAKEYFDQILDRVKGNLDETNHVFGTFMCQGKMPESVKKRYEMLKEQNPTDNKYEMLLANFDLASSHPDQNDIHACIKAVEL